MPRARRRKSKVIPRSVSPGLRIVSPEVSGFESTMDEVALTVAGVDTPHETAAKKRKFASPPGVQTRRMKIRNEAMNLKRLENDAGEDSSQNVTTVNSGPNAMNVDVVMKEVMKYLDADTLMKCRRVSKVWNEVSNTYLRSRHDTVVLDKDRTLALKPLLKKSVNFPFNKFKFQTRFTGAIERSFSTFGQNIKQIQIHAWHNAAKISFPDVFKMLKYLPNVKKLMLVNIEFPKLPAGQQMPDHATLSAPPPLVVNSVETLNFTGWFLPSAARRIDMRPLNMHCQQYLADVFNSVPQVKRLELDILRSSIVQNFMVGIGRLVKLESISIRCLEEKDLIYIIRSHKDLPNLTSITFGEVYLTQHGTVLLEVLKVYASRLTHMDIRINNTRPLELISFPEMTLLETLHLDTVHNVERSPQGDNLSITPIQIPFPYLKRMITSRGVLQGMSVGKFTAPCVTEVVLKMALPLPIARPRTDSGEEVIKNLTLIYPALRKLKVVEIYPEALATLFGNVRQLEHLEICRGFRSANALLQLDLSPVLTGLEYPEVHARMVARYSENPLVPADKKNNALEFILASAVDSIRSMTNLKVLVFSGAYCIQPCAVDLALLQMQPLEKLVFGENSMQFGDASLEKLNKYHKFVYIKKKPVPKILKRKAANSLPDLIAI